MVSGISDNTHIELLILLSKFSNLRPPILPVTTQ